MKLKYYILIIGALLLNATGLQAKDDSISVKGTIVDHKTKEPLSGVAIRLGTDYLWTISDSNGAFAFENVMAGEYQLEVSCLGFVTETIKISAKKSIKELIVELKESSLALDGVIVTAKQSDGLNTSYSLGRDALNHLQLSNMTDVSSLLPGGKTINPDLTTDKKLSLREGGLAGGNASFGTAVEVDGVRLGGNAGFGEMEGVSTRNVAVENIESVEVITGVPSAEYGDLNAGLVRIHTKKGRTPVSVTFSVNPRTYQTSASKGVELGKDRGVLNVSAEWAKAVKKLVSPYQAYNRAGFTFNYSNTFKKKLNFEAGFTGNIGGMDAKDDPDAFTGAFEKGRDNNFRGNFAAKWLINKPGITNLKFDGSLSFQDNLLKTKSYANAASSRPAVHSEEEGYSIATQLPMGVYYPILIEDSKELIASLSAKYEWVYVKKRFKSRLKAGIQWQADGNVGEGEYYSDPLLAANGYRPRPYHEYPFMHNLSTYIEENINFPIGSTKLELMAGLRMENVFIKGSLYNKKTTFSPRFNVKWDFNETVSLRGGWGITEKLPSFFILFPRQEYRDLFSFGYTAGQEATYIYYTQPYQMLHNSDLKWQRNSNAELGVDLHFLGTRVSLVGFYNITMNPYYLSTNYTPLSYNVYKRPLGYTIEEGAQVRLDKNTGAVEIAPKGSDVWTPMELLVTDRTFVGTTQQRNGANIHRAGTELIVDFPEIKPIKTSFRLDAAYSFTQFIDASESQIYQSGRSHTSIKNRSYQYVGIYAMGGRTSSTSNGRKAHNLDANLTAITHIPQAKIIITCRLEMSLLKRYRNLSEHEGWEYAYNASSTSTAMSGGSIYDGNSYTAIHPLAYIDLDGKVHKFEKKHAEDPEFNALIIKSGNEYTFAQDGYGPYMSANLSITKEIGKHVSLSFFANNFTNSRMAVKSMATGVSAIFTPNFYYGLTCRVKF